MDKKGNGNRDELAAEEHFSQLSLSTSLSAGERASKFSNLTYLSFLNIRLKPGVIAFIDAFEGKHFDVDISIQNIGRNPIKIKVGEPKSCVSNPERLIFRLKKPSPHPLFLGSGCSIKGTVSYTYHKAHLVQTSQIPLRINGRLLHYPIIVKPAQPEVEVEPKKLHFKVINLGASAKTMKLTITNSGGIRTKFEVDVGKNHLGLVVHPSRGTIKAKESKNICVEMMGLMEGEFYQELWLSTEGAPIRIPVLVEVVWPRLKVLYPKGTEEITLIDFRPTFVGTQKLASFTLNNFGAEVTSYVIWAEINGELEVLKNAKKTVEEFDMFVFGTEEGYLQPFETRILSVLFCPKSQVKNKGWHIDEKSNRTKREFVAFVRISRVHCLEWKEYESEIKPSNYITIEEKDSFDFTRSSFNVRDGLLEGVSRYYHEPKEEILRLCLHGQAIEPDIIIEPSSLDFGDLNVGEKNDRVLRITNNNSIAVKCNLCKTANIKTTPEEVWLHSEKSQEFLVSLTAQNSGSFTSKIKVQIFARSDPAFNSSKTTEMIAAYTVNISYDAKHITLAPKPKIGLGLTPLITDNVGLNKDLVTFKDAGKLPFAAMLGLKHGFKPAWMQQEKDQLNNVENAIVALPNDRPHNFATWPKDKICRTIFTGYLRYSPPEDIFYTLLPEERSKKEEQCAMWADYISLLRRLRLSKTKIKNLKCLIEYDLSCKKISNLKLFKTDLELYEKNIKIVKVNENTVKNALVPLSALNLIRISVNPKLINFNLVAVSTKARESVTISNMNPFHISLKFNSGNSAVSVIDDSTFTVPPMATKSVDVCFETNALGRYFGFLNYVINGCHEFKISIFAFVTSKTLVMKKEYTSFEFKKFEPKDTFQPNSMYLPVENPTQAPIKYHWVFANDSMFTTGIMQGEIPPRSELLIEVFYKLNPKKIFYSEAKLISEDGTENLIKLFKPSSRVVVNFLKGHMDMGDVPLNLPTKVEAVIKNSGYHDVVFELVNANPMPGIVVEPKKGIIKRRSSFALEISVQIPIIMKFSFEVHVNVNFAYKISTTVVGKVVPPNIRMRPSRVTIRRICVQSFDVFSICVENAGTTPAEVAIDLQSFPEFNIAKDQANLYLLPKKSSEVIIRFEPENATRYSFYLPVVLNNILGPPSSQSQETELVTFYISEFTEMYQNYGDITRSKTCEMKLPCVSLISNVSPCLLKVSPLNLDFKMEDNLYSPPQIVEILNVFTGDVTFCIRNDDLGEINSSPFNLKPVSDDQVENRHKSIKVQLQPNEKFTLMATFEPEKPGLYNNEIPIFVKGYNEGLVYNYIRMSGEYKPPRIFPDISEIHFSPVPLNVGSETTLTVTAENYRSPDLIKCAICETKEDEFEETEDCLTTEWLKEPRITEQKQNNVFYLKIKFESSLPIALRKYILLFDSTGRYSSVLVTAIADNSIMTNYAFISARSSNYKIIKDTQIAQKVTIDEVFLKYPIKKSDLILQERAPKMPKKSKSKSYTRFSFEETQPNLSGTTVNPTNNPSSLPIYKGPKLVINMTKSMESVTELHFVNIHKNLALISEEIKSTVPILRKNSSNSTMSLANSQSSSVAKHLLSSQNVKIHTGSPIEENPLGYFPKTCDFVERWIFEVVMRCEQYFSIPQSFQRLREVEAPPKNKTKEKVVEVPMTKDFLDFLREIIGNDQGLPERPSEKANDYEIQKIIKLRTFFGNILEYLCEKGCLLPHVRPEYLLDYEYYSEYMGSETEHVELFFWANCDDNEAKRRSYSKTEMEQTNSKPMSEKEALYLQNSTSFLARESWKKLLFENLSLEPEVDIEKLVDEKSEAAEVKKQLHFDSCGSLIGKQFEHQIEILDQQTFELISTQAWLDVLIQIFKVFVLSKIDSKTMIPQITVVEMNEKLPLESTKIKSVRNYGKKIKDDCGLNAKSLLTSNIYSCQEKILLRWLNNHLQIQKENLWNSRDECFFKAKIINNFDNDLSDSVALLSVTASHCPYIVSTHFSDVFLKPDTPNKKQHNAGKLIEAWRALEIGLTLETADIISPNTAFMTMVVTHLYEVLPGRYPHSLVCFSAPLNGEISRKFPVKCESDKRLALRPKLFGDYEGYFSLPESLINLKPSKVTNISVKFKAKKIEKASAVLFLSGCAASPNFAKSLTYYLEGKPSEIPECEKFSISAPLYKVICSDIPLNPPVNDPTTYEVWYTSKQPEFNRDCPDVKTLFSPWSEIWNRKLSRRLFINKRSIEIQENLPTTLGVTLACFTNEKRFFWLLFRSKISDFIVRVEIKPKTSEEHVITVFNSESDSTLATCTCPDQNSLNLCECSFLTELKIPMRNDNLWKALRTMFFKTLLPQEKPFWNKHFEMDIGLCLILWLLRPDEEEEVLEEFVQVLPTKVKYVLNVQQSNDYVTLPQFVEISDVRENGYVVLPLHISNKAPPEFSFELTMLAENTKEIRNLKVFVVPSTSSVEFEKIPPPKEEKNLFCLPVG